MGRPKKNNLTDVVKNIISSKKMPETKKDIKEEVAINTSEVTEETVPVTEATAQETSEETPKQFVEEVVYTNDNQPKDTTNFKPVQVIKDSELEYLRKRSEVIVRLKQDPKYKFLSKVALIKIADIYMQKNY